MEKSYSPYNMVLDGIGFGKHCSNIMSRARCYNRTVNILRHFMKTHKECPSIVKSFVRSNLAHIKRARENGKTHIMLEV